MSDKVLLDLSGTLEKQLENMPDDVKADVETLTRDREALAAIVAAIMANKRLAWLITAAWVEEHKYKLTRE